jgi:uncharacterized protein
MNTLPGSADTQRPSCSAEPTPFVHKFKTERHKYVFDVNTLRILEVAPVVWDIVEDYGKLTPEELICKHGNSYGSQEIVAACEAISISQKKDGLLLNNRPLCVTMPYTDEIVRQRIETQRELLILDTTQRCNFRCLYCAYNGRHQHRRPHAPLDMSLDVARRAIHDYLAHCPPDGSRNPPIAFYGGEPLLNLALLKQIVAETRDLPDGRHPDFSVTTNASLLAGDAAEFLAAENFAVTVTMDGPRDIHDRQRKSVDGSDTWGQVVSNVIAFLSRYPQYRDAKFTINTVLAPPVDVVAIKDFFLSCDFLPVKYKHMFLSLSPESTGMLPFEVKLGLAGYEALYGTFVAGLLRGAGADGSPERAFLNDLFLDEYAKFHKRGYNPVGAGGYGATYGFCSTCVPGSQRLFVKTDGSYYPCERVQDETECVRIGSVWEGIDLSKVRWLLQEYANMHGDVCRECWCLPVCSATCFASLQDGESLSRDRQNAECESSRSCIHKLMEKYCTILEGNNEAFRFVEPAVLRRDMK